MTLYQPPLSLSIAVESKQDQTQKTGDQMNVWPISAINQDGKNRCANCGKPEEDAKAVIVGFSMYDGEWCCCTECEDEHDSLGCPFEHGIRYRDLK